MRFTSIILLILVATMATLAAPAKENKLVRIPFTKAVRRRSNFPHSMETRTNANATSVFSRRATSTITLTSFREIVWRGTIALGTPQQNFRFIMDTGGGSTWVVDNTCQGNCGRDQYNGGASSTFTDLAKPFTAKYDNGETVAGTWTADNLGLGFNSDVIVTQQIFGRANQVPTDLVTDYDSSGILGLGYRTRVSEEPDIPVLIENLRSQNVIDKNIISCHFIKNDDIDAGEILFGGVDDEFISGDILYTPIVFNQGLPDWIIPIADIQVAGSSLGQSDLAYFDTGMGDIFLSDAAAQAVYAGIPGAEHTDDDGWIVPAPFPSDVSLVVGQRAFTIPAADLLTDIQIGDKFVGTIQGGANNLWVIGDAFIKNQYVVFDFEANAIGIANRNDL